MPLAISAPASVPCEDYIQHAEPEDIVNSIIPSPPPNDIERRRTVEVRSMARRWHYTASKQQRRANTKHNQRAAMHPRRHQVAQHALACASCMSAAAAVLQLQHPNQPQHLSTVTYHPAPPQHPSPSHVLPPAPPPAGAGTGSRRPLPRSRPPAAAHVHHARRGGGRGDPHGPRQAGPRHMCPQRHAGGHPRMPLRVCLGAAGPSAHRAGGGQLCGGWQIRPHRVGGPGWVAGQAWVGPHLCDVSLCMQGSFVCVM